MAFPDLSNLRDNVRTIINEATAAFWTDAELNRLINDGERDVAIKSLCLENIDTATTTASTRLVQFSGHKILHVEYTDATYPLGLIRIRPNQLGRIPYNGATPQFYFQWGNQVIIDPIPATTYNLNLYIADYPEYEMSSDTDEPQVPKRFHELIILHAVYRALMKDRKFATAGAIYQAYSSELQLARAQVIERYPDLKDDYKIPDRVVAGGAA